MEKVSWGAILLTLGMVAAKKRTLGRMGRVVKALQTIFIIKVIATVTLMMFFTL